MTIVNKYSYGPYSNPRTNLDKLKKINSIKVLVNNLNENLIDKIVLRYPKQYEYPVNFKFQEKAFNKKVKFDHCDLSFHEIMREGKLFIHDSNQTGFLETMYHNLPTILLLDKMINENIT